MLLKVYQRVVSTKIAFSHLAFTVGCAIKNKGVHSLPEDSVDAQYPHMEKQRFREGQSVKIVASLDGM